MSQQISHGKTANAQKNHACSAGGHRFVHSTILMHAQVRAAFLSEDGHCETKKLAKHGGRAHKLALDPDQPHCFFSSGEDGAVISFDMRTKKSVKLLVCKTAARPGSDTVSEHASTQTLHACLLNVLCMHVHCCVCSMCQ